MPSCIGGIKASTAKKAAPHFGFAGYAYQTISKTTVVLELTVCHNHIISFSICSLLLQGSIWPCAAEHKRAWGLVCLWQHPRCEHSTLQRGWASQAPTRDHRAGPHNLPSSRDWCNHYPVACPTENSIWHFDLNGLHSTWSLFQGHGRRLCRKTACTTLLKSTAPQFMSRHRYKTSFFTSPKPALSWRKSWLYNYTQNHLFKVYHVFFPHPGNKKGISR